MRRDGMRGIALLDVLIALAVLGIVLSVVLPAALSLYARAAVEYEAVHLIGELRRIQAISRMSERLDMLPGRRSWERMPRLRIQSDGYVLRRPFGSDLRVHETLPLVRFKQETTVNMPVVFNAYGNISNDWSHNMTIRVYVAGHEEDALRVVIDRAARIRLHRGEENALAEE